jgi:hypothetical protein
LTIASRIMAAFGSGALVAVFFLPAWRIDLFCSAVSRRINHEYMDQWAYRRC